MTRFLCQKFGKSRERGKFLNSPILLHDIQIASDQKQKFYLKLKSAYVLRFSYNLTRHYSTFCGFLFYQAPVTTFLYNRAISLFLSGTGAIKYQGARQVKIIELPGGQINVSPSSGYNFLFHSSQQLISLGPLKGFLS